MYYFIWIHVVNPRRAQTLSSCGRADGTDVYLDSVLQRSEGTFTLWWSAGECSVSHCVSEDMDSLVLLFPAFLAFPEGCLHWERERYWNKLTTRIKLICQYNIHIQNALTHTKLNAVMLECHRWWYLNK